MTSHLESLAKDWIEWFCQFEIIVLLGETLGYEQLHTLDRVRSHRSVVKIYRHAALLPTLHFELRIVAHAFDRETGPCKIEVPAINLFS